MLVGAEAPANSPGHSRLAPGAEILDQNSSSVVGWRPRTLLLLHLILPPPSHAPCGWEHSPERKCLYSQGASIYIERTVFRVTDTFCFPCSRIKHLVVVEVVVVVMSGSLEVPSSV